ncbi:MAG: hypothetical protein P1U83_05785 [Roseovarius sp.]|nr:hypothetical protein [Roseovarius sp.]
MRHRLVAPSVRISDDLLDKSNLFSSQFFEFWSNYEELLTHLGGVRVSLHFELQNDNTMTGSGFDVSRHRLKGLYLDYRKFHSQNEPICFLQFCNSLKRTFREECAQQELDDLKQQWISPEVPVVGWHNDFTVADVIESYFNEELFHVGTNSKTSVSIREIRKQWGPQVLDAVTSQIVLSRLLLIRNLNWMVEPILIGDSKLRIPI